MSEYYTTFGPAAIIAFGTIFAAIVKVRKRPRTNRTEHIELEGRERRETATAFSIILIGLLVALGAIVIAQNIHIFNLSGSVAEVRQDILRDAGPLLTDLPRTPENIGRELSFADKEAAALLEGDGLSEWKTHHSALKRGDIFYVPSNGFFDVVVPDDNSNRVQPESCSLVAKGKLYVRGFSEARQAALVEYEAPMDTWGSQCETETYLFYPVPNRVH